MLLLNCKNLRSIVILSLVLFLLGLLLQLPRVLLLSAYPSLAVLLSGIGLVAVFLSPLIMVAAALMALTPGALKHLKLCNH